MIEEVDLGTGDVEVSDYHRRIRAEATINELVREVNRLTATIASYNEHSHNGVYGSRPIYDGPDKPVENSHE